MIDRKKNLYRNYLNSLDLVNPLQVFKRGYAYVKKNDKIIKDIKDIEIDDLIDVSVSKGSFKAKVVNKKED